MVYKHAAFLNALHCTKSERALHRGLLGATLGQWRALANICNNLLCYDPPSLKLTLPQCRKLASHDWFSSMLRTTKFRSEGQPIISAEELANELLSSIQGEDDLPLSCFFKALLSPVLLTLYKQMQKSATHDDDRQSSDEEDADEEDENEA